MPGAWTCVVAFLENIVACAAALNVETGISALETKIAKGKKTLMISSPDKS